MITVTIVSIVGIIRRGGLAECTFPRPASRNEIADDTDDADVGVSRMGSE